MKILLMSSVFLAAVCIQAQQTQYLPRQSGVPTSARGGVKGGQCDEVGKCNDFSVKNSEQGTQDYDKLTPYHQLFNGAKAMKIEDFPEGSYLYVNKHFSPPVNHPPQLPFITYYGRKRHGLLYINRAGPLLNLTSHLMSDVRVIYNSYGPTKYILDNVPPTGEVCPTCGGQMQIPYYRASQDMSDPSVRKFAKSHSGLAVTSKDGDLVVISTGSLEGFYHWDDHDRRVYLFHGSMVSRSIYRVLEDGTIIVKKEFETGSVSRSFVTVTYLLFSRTRDQVTTQQTPSIDPNEP